MPKSLTIFLSAGALAIGVAACGGSSSSSGNTTGGGSATSPAASATATSGGGSSATTPSSSSGASSAKGDTVNLGVMGSMLMFNTKTLTAKAGKVSIVFTNNSGLGHNVTVQQGTNGKMMGATPTFSSGTHTLTLTLKKGTYTFYCSVPGHRAAGMQGTLKVT